MIDPSRRSSHQHYYSTTAGGHDDDKDKYSLYAKYHVPVDLRNNINLYAAHKHNPMEMRPLPPIPKSPGPQESGSDGVKPEDLSGDGVFGVPSPHTGDFCTMPLPGRSNHKPPSRGLVEYTDGNAPHYFELDPDGLPLPPPPEGLMASVDVAPVHKSMDNNNRKQMPNGIALPGVGLPRVTEEDDKVTSSGEDSKDTLPSPGMAPPPFDYTGLGEEYRETGKFSWP